MDAISQLKSFMFPIVLAVLPTLHIPNARDIVTQIIFEMIRDDFLQSEHNPKRTIYEHCDGAGHEEIIKRYSRYREYADYYRTINNEFLKGYAGTDIEELIRQPLTKPEDHFKGVPLSEYQFLQLDCIYDIPLLKDIISKRITNVKKISNNELQDKFNGYRETLVYMKPSGTDDIKQLMWALNFFSLESRYQVLSVYRVASLLSKYNNSKSKEKFSDDELTEMLKLFATIIVDEKYIIENAMLPIRLKTIEQLSPGYVKNPVQRYTDLLQRKSEIKLIISQRSDIQVLLSSLTLPEIRKFIDEEYNLSDLLKPKFEWSSKKELFVRKLYDKILKDVPAPPIK